MKNKGVVCVCLSAQDEAGFAPGWVSPAGVLRDSVFGGSSRRGGGLWCLLLLLALPVLLGTLIILFLSILILSSLLPDQRCSRVVDGGEFRLRVLREQQWLLDSSQRSRGFPAQRSCRSTRWWVVPPVGVGVVWTGEDVGHHLVLALGGGVIVCAEGDVGGPARRPQHPGAVFNAGLHSLEGGGRRHLGFESLSLFLVFS